MADYKSVQDLIFKTAMHDGVTTTIRAVEMGPKYNIIELRFSKGGYHAARLIDIEQANTYDDPEDIMLYECKETLRELFMAPYND